MEQTELCDVGGNVWSRQNCVMWEGVCVEQTELCDVGGNVWSRQNCV